MKRFDVEFEGADGIRLAGMARGPEDGPTVLMLHGGGQTHWAWRRTVEALANRGFRAVAVDMRGHGDSDWSPGGLYRHDVYGHDMVAVAKQLPPKVAMVGASLGGIAGMIAEGLLSPGLFSSLTLVDITAKPNMDGVARIQKFMGTHVVEGFASLEEAAEVIAGYAKNRDKRGPSDSLARYLRLGEDGRYRWHWDPAFMNQFDIAKPDSRAEMVAAATNLNLPVHLIRGGASDLVTAEDADEFLKLVPHARYTDIAGAGHMVVGDRNDAFSEAIIAFLEEHRQS
jgi:pimeloyl-ACP methyl ester carboxylesterase